MRNLLLTLTILLLACTACTRCGGEVARHHPVQPIPTEPQVASGPQLGAAPVRAEPRVDCKATADGRDFPVGPGQTYASIGDVPFESLRAGDSVRIYWRDEPYREKLMIGGKGTVDRPIRVCGVAGPDGQRPVIDGENATTRKQLDFPFDGHQVRGLVIIGHPHEQPWADTPTYILLEGLEVRNSAPPYSFTDKAGKKADYSNIAAGIFVERVNHLVIRDCKVIANNNGIFIASSGDMLTLSQNILLEGNYILENGSLGDWYEHNVYNEGSNVVYQFNRFGSPRGGKVGVLGANIKERSAGVVIRYNWIEDGAHVMDIVDCQESQDVTRDMPTFHATYVYGNIIIRGPNPSGSMIHYGGDSGIFKNYRKGTLYFYENTVIVKNDDYPKYARTALFELSTNEEHLDSRDNVFFSTDEPSDNKPIGLLGERDDLSSGIASFNGDWLKKGWTIHDFSKSRGIKDVVQVTGFDALARGDSPGFRSIPEEDFELTGTSPGVSLAPDLPADFVPKLQYVKHQKSRPRPDGPSLGAFRD